MKKIPLIISLLVISLLSFAANLNPFAYNLSSELSADQSTLTVHYTLNAAANSVSVRVLQNGQVVKTDPYYGTAKDKGDHTLIVDMSSLPAGTYTWDIQVTGTSVGNPTQVENYYSFYCPQGLAIDKDPNSNYFGRILVSEAMQAVPSSGYISSGKGAGLYVFNPDFTTDKVVHKGGLNFTRILTTNGYQPWRIKISDDGRIFVSSLDLNGVAVWEVSKDLQTWTPVISGTNNSNDYIIYNSNGSFLAGPNCSMDVIGSGEGLKLLLYSCSKKAIESYNQSWYRLDEYALGTATTFTGTPKNIIEGGAFGVTHNYIDVIYDQAGGYWFGASRGGNASQPNLVHIKADGEEDYRDESDTNYGGGGVLLHNGMLFKGKKYEGGTDGKFGVYTISKNQSTGKLVLTEKYAVTSVGLKRSHNAFAVDYAENLYVVGNDGERIIAFALPYSGSVTTPAAAKYNVVLSSNAQLNPFAYGLRSSLDANNPMQLNVSFSVNAPATSVEVVVYDVETNEVAYTQACQTYSEKHDYQFAIDLSKISAEYRDGVKNLNWRVDVKGSAVNTPTMIDQEYYFYHPRSIDIDNNPENPNFGHVFVIEGLHDITTKTGTDIGASGKPFNKYSSWGVGAGLYVFDAAFQNLPTPNATAGYNGGLTYTAAEKISVTSNGKTHDYNVYAPNRVKVSDDGRVFITLCAPVNRGVLLEADKYIFSNAEDRPANWSATSWKKVLVGTRDANTEELEDANGNFIAALNCDIDTKGSGKDLQIMLLSGTKNALLAIADQYTFSEYKLGENTQWNSAPTKTWKLDNAVVAYNVAEIVYDNEGGYWMCQDRRNKDEAIKYPTLMHVNKDGVVDLKEKMMNRGGAGICFNKDFTKLIVSGKSSTSPISGVSSASSYSTATLAWATIYTISKVNGAPKLTKEYEIDMTSLGNNIPDFAWDHANNIYACGYSYEKLKAWALPHDADDVVSTPAASKYAFITKPFAYDLRRTIEGDGRTKLHFMLNADAKKVQVWLIDEETKQEIRLRNYPNEKSENKDFVPYHSEGYGTVITTEDVETLGLEYGKNYSWRVDVWVTESDASKFSALAGEEHTVNLTQPVPRIVAYNLTYRPNGANQTYDFSFYANTQPTGGSISFYKNGETTPLYVHQISNLIQGNNTVSIPMATLDAYLNLEKDITWELTLSAPESQVFGKIYKSGELNTAYATINTNPATDYFGHVYAGNQQNHVSAGSGGNIYVWAPGSGTNNNQGDRYHTIQTAFTPTLSPNNKKGFTQVSAPGIAPDGKVYFTDNGKTGGVSVMDPKDYSIASFFERLEQNDTAQYLYNSNPVGTPSSSAHIYWPGGNTAKLFLVSTEYYTKTNIGSQNKTLHRHNAGYYIYPLTEQDGQWVHSRNWGETQKVTVTEDNIYQPNFTIVGTSHGVWYCQHRRNDLDVDESRSLMFFDNNGVRQYCSTDEDEIYGSAGSAIAVNKEETLLAMASGLGGIMFFDIDWSDDVPTLTYKYTSALNNNDVVTTLNFDYNGNLVATVGDTYNDETDKHRMVVFTMPKEGENTVTVPARFSQRVAALYADERMDVHFDGDITSPYQTVDVFRRLQAGMCNTICLPFSLDSLKNTPYENAKVFAFTGVTPGNDQVELQFSEVNAMQAGVPYLIQPENDITDLLRFSPVQVNASFNNQGLSVTYDGITYHGTINPKRLEVDKNYLFLVANNRLATASAGGDMLGLRGYFTVNGKLPAKAVISFREGVYTGTTSTVTLTTDDVQKVLQNQQILIIRDGKIYNILGETIATK